MKLSERMATVVVQLEAERDELLACIEVMQTANFGYMEENSALKRENEGLHKKAEALLDAVVKSPIYHEVKDTYHWVRIAVDALLADTKEQE